jgi:peptide/nickel transport system substrate-binding protein
MKRSTRWILATALAAGLVAACTAPPQEVKEKAEAAASSPAASGTPAARSTATATTAAIATPATTSPAATQKAAEASATAYDPSKDPLVNPKEMFEPFPDKDPGKADQNDSLVLNMEGNPTSLNPFFWSSMQDDQAQGPIYDALFGFDKKLQWEVNPDMVESFKEAPDHLSSVAVLRPGLQWQDGQPYTSEDVAFSWHAIMDSAIPIPAIRTGTDQLADVKALNARTVKFVYKEALATNQWNIGFPVIPKHVYDNPAERKKDPTLSASDYFNRYNREGVVGNGAYKLVKWAANDQLVYERWDAYPGRKPHFKRLTYKIIPDMNTTLLRFKNGDLDMIERLKPQQFAKETNDAAFAAHGYKAMAPRWEYGHIGWNMDGSNPFFADKAVRVALAHALDQQAILEKIEYNLSTPCVGIFHPDSWMYNPAIRPIKFDLDEAARELDQAGWKINPDDGWRYKTIGGAPVKFEFELLIPEGSPTGVQVAALYAANLKKIGVSLKTRVVEWAFFQEQTLKHKFQAEVSATSTGSDPDGEWNEWHSDQYDNGRNYGGYKNPEVDKLLEAGRRAMDFAKRRAIYQKIDKIIYDDQPWAFLTDRLTMTAVAKRLRGIMFAPTGVTGFDPGMSGWWTPKGMALRP